MNNRSWCTSAAPWVDRPISTCAWTWVRAVNSPLVVLSVAIAPLPRSNSRREGNMSTDSNRQWLPFCEVRQPFQALLRAIYHKAPQNFVVPRHFKLSVRDGNLLWVSGQVPRFNHEI